MVYVHDDSDKALYDELLDNESPTLRDSLLSTGDNDALSTHQGGLVIGFENAGFRGIGTTVTNEDYNDDSLCMLSEERKDKEKESTQGTLVRGLECKGLPSDIVVTNENLDNDPCIANKYRELCVDEIATEDNYIFDLESADSPSDTTIMDEDSDSLCVPTTEGTKSHDINVGLPKDDNKNKDKNSKEMALPSDNVMETLYSFERTMEESRAPQERLAMANQTSQCKIA